MTLNSLNIFNFRNLETLELDTLGRANLFFGENGSGKTSILEAIYMLAMNKSFRSHKIKSIVRYGYDKCAVRGDLNIGEFDVSVEMLKALNGDDSVCINHNKARSFFELATLLPVQLITSNGVRLLEDGPLVRRQFLDWGVFHVEHQFVPIWKKFQRALKQRNCLLRSRKVDPMQLSFWDRELICAAERIDLFRSRYFEMFSLEFCNLFNRLFDEMLNINVDYYRGWDKSKKLQDVLEHSLKQDVEIGYTRFGPQKADIKILVNGLQASHQLSRGQEKALVAVLKITQGILFSKLSFRSCVYLIDDFSSELDQYYQGKIVDLLASTHSQLFFTNVFESSLNNKLISKLNETQNENIKTFYINKGKIKKCIA